MGYNKTIERHCENFNIITEYPIKVFIPCEAFNKVENSISVKEKHELAKSWIIEEFGYPEFHKKYWVLVMGYIVVRFKNEEDAAYFRLVWA